MSSVPLAQRFAPVGQRVPTFGRVVGAIAGREREVRDTLWLLAALAWVMAPHMLELPIWASAALAALVVWRGWLTWQGHRLPNRWIPIALTCIAGIAVWVQYRTIFGKDAGVAYVTLLLGLKLLEMRARRDIFVVIFLCLFVMLTSLFESQSIAMAAMLVVGLWMLVTALVSVQFARLEPPWRTKATIGARLVLFALPLMAVLFVLFPRIEGPLWGMPSDAYSAKTGLTDTMAPGSFGKLSESREIAFRVQFDGRVPAPSERYWRGPVLGAFDGRAWTPLPTRRAPARRAIDVDPASAVDYATTLEPASRSWLFALDIMTAAPEVRAGSRLLTPRLRPDLQVTADAPFHDRVLFKARSYTRYHVGVDETRATLQDWVELPPGFNRRTHALAATMQGDEDRVERATGRTLDDGERSRKLVAAVLTMIRTQPFVYTLDPPPLGRDSVDEFLFDTRRGYCEHYASAFTVLMRALDVPARVVTGYQGGEINPVDQFLEVRQRDAHAWSEVWIAGQGWIRVDPTAAVAPDRIERGAAEALGGVQGYGVEGSWLASLVQKSRFQWDAVGNAWNQWVLAYNGDRQSGLFAGLGIERIDWQGLTVALIVAFGTVLAVIAAATLFRRIKVDPLVAQYERACALLARAADEHERRRGGSTGAGDVSAQKARATARGALARRPAEGSRAYLARLGDRLPADLRAKAEKAFEHYEALRYARRGADFDEAAVRARFVASVAALRA